MTEKATAIGVLDKALEIMREEAGLEPFSPRLGPGAGKDERLFSIADKVAATQPDLLPLPKTGALTTLLIVIFLAALLFLAVIFFVPDQDLLPLLVGQGTIFAALTGIAAYLARIQSASVKAYNERAAEWMRIDAVVRVLRDVSRGNNLSPEMSVALLDALRGVFPAQIN